MAYKMVTRNGVYLENQDVYICDTATEVTSITKAPFGSIAQVTEDGSIWMRKSNGTWVEQPKEASQEAIEAAQEAVAAAAEAVDAAQTAAAAAETASDATHFTDFDNDKTYTMAWGTSGGYPVLRLTENE